MAWYRVQRGAEPPELDAQSAHHDTLICVQADEKDELLGYAEGVCDTCGLARIPASVVEQYEVSCDHRDAEEVEVCYLLGGLCVAGDRERLGRAGRPSQQSPVGAPSPTGDTQNYPGGGIADA